MTIIEEIADWQCKEMMEGRNPTEIKLSDEQKGRLDTFIKESRLEFVTTGPPENRILGMKIL